MISNNMGYRCKYANECPVYLAKSYNGDIPHYLFKNIYCNRGKKGWINCDTYNAYENKSFGSIQTNN